MKRIRWHIELGEDSLEIGAEEVEHSENSEGNNNGNSKGIANSDNVK